MNSTNNYAIYATSNSTITNFGNITTSAGYGMYVEDNSSAANKNSITMDGNSWAGIWANSSNSNGTNYGTISFTSSGDVMRATNNATVLTTAQFLSTIPALLLTVWLLTQMQAPSITATSL